MQPYRAAAAFTLCVLLACMGVTPAHGQSATRSTRLTFKSASAAENGFVHGSLDLDYRVANCGSGPHVMYTVRRGTVLGYEGYWYEGKLYGLQPGWVPDPTLFRLKTTLAVTFGAQEVRRWEAVNPQISSQPLTCALATQFVGLGSWSDLLGENPTDDQKAEALNRIDLQQVFSTEQPLRSDAVERDIRRQLDAAQQATEAARPQASQAGPATRPAGAASSAPVATSGGGAATAPAASGASAARPAQPPMSYEERNRRHNDSLAAVFEERRQAVEAQAQARQQMMQGLEEIAREYGRARAEQDAAERERRAQRYEEWRQKWEAEYGVVRAENLARAGNRPACPPGRSTTGKIDREGQVSGTLDGTECRRPGMQSADVYHFGDMKMGLMEVQITASGFRPMVHIEQSGHIIATSNREGYLKAHFTTDCATCYTLVVTSLDYGEVGSYHVETDWLGWSQATGVSVSPFFRWGSYDTDEGIAAAETGGWGVHIAGSWWKMKAFVEFSKELGSLPYTNEFDRERTAWQDALSWMVGARYLFLSEDASFRPYAELAYGLRSRDGMELGEVYKGRTLAPGVGVEFFGFMPFTATLGVSQFRTTYSERLVDGEPVDSPGFEMKDVGLRWTLGLSWYIQPARPVF